MRKIFGIMAIGLAIGVMAGQPVLAQGRGGRGMGRGGFRQTPTMLLGREEVENELKLTGEQKDKLKPILESARPNFGRGGGGGQNLSDEERQARFEEFQKKAEAANKEAVAVLDDSQRARLKQIEIWANGTLSTLTQDEEIGKQLSLTDEQKGAFKTISEEVGKKMMEIGGKMRDQGLSQDERGKLFQEMGEVRKDADAEALAVLTPDQVSQFEKIKGPKFDLPFGFGRGGRGRRGGNNN